MSKPEPLEPGRIQPTYSGFVVLRLNEIWGVWRGNPEQALDLALKLASTLVPKKIKKKLKHDVEVIGKDLDQAYRTPGVDWYTRQQNRNRAARRVANHYIVPFLSKLSNLLDEWGYYEVPSRRLKAKDYQELEKDEG